MSLFTALPFECYHNYRHIPKLSDGLLPCLSIPKLEERPTKECPVCFEGFSNPKVFPKCGHSICAGCEKRITVKNQLLRTKIITCPICRCSVNLASDECLPHNWSLKEHLIANDKMNEATSSTLSARCSDCGETISRKNTFNCRNCSSRERNAEAPICGACVVRNHSPHISSVIDVLGPNRHKKVEFETGLKEELVSFMRDELTKFKRAFHTIDKPKDRPNTPQKLLFPSYEKLLEEKKDAEKKREIGRQSETELAPCTTNLKNDDDEYVFI
ncbi:hypothetical protein QR680_004352 [Steinernema hermaphroditum]|uniref:RING-type domain-containing protein n=1 Tax=Steinernema hermaphroditum TaxID=289476 RepID=A0AA39HPI8_9BILA|nr:hypothetical protein QR680_004352 [Steinernema hermaphroditum]